MLRLLLVAIGIGVGSAQAADLSVKIRGAASSDGVVSVGLFNKAEDFPREVVTGQTTPARSGVVTVIFRDLPPGSYAVSAFHDLNGNGKLDSNAFGVPSEPYGFSRNARGSFGPPRFVDAKVDLGAQELSIEIELK